MRLQHPAASQPAVGIAYSEYVHELVAAERGLIDYVEIPFEHLVRSPTTLELKEHVPVVLHCASLSLAGNVEPDPRLASQLMRFVRESETPWLGEHIAYVRADEMYREIAEHDALYGEPDISSLETDLALPDIGSSAFNIGYTVSPQMSPPVLDRVIESSTRWSKLLGVPVLLENGPIYFVMPGSSMSQVEFIQSLCARLESARLLLDLSHLAITCSNLNFDSSRVLESLPLDRVVEVHISGAREAEGVVWDDHALPAPPIVFELFEQLLERSNPSAVTLEYNWDSDFPRIKLEKDVRRVRDIIGRHWKTKSVRDESR